MHTHLHTDFADNLHAKQATVAIAQCVHCGFCNATCPTYQQAYSENDGPRGRIYLIKHMLESGKASSATAFHLDRCLTCQSCVTTCPSGVRYGDIIAYGRQLLESLHVRSWWQKTLRFALFYVLRSFVFRVGMAVARRVNSLLPLSLSLLPKAYYKHTHATSVTNDAQQPMLLLLAGCVQDAILPSINHATITLALTLGYKTQLVQQKCCSALPEHLGLHKQAYNDDANVAHSLLQHAKQASVIGMNASGCSVSLRGLPDRLCNQLTEEQQQTLRNKIKDFSVWVASLDISQLTIDKTQLPNAIAYHSPCTLQHGLKSPTAVQDIFAQLGVTLLVPQDAHLCCGSAGTYSILEPRMAGALRHKKLVHLHELQPDIILSANIGCIQHLQQKTATPVVHWVEFLARLLLPQK